MLPFAAFVFVLGFIGAAIAVPVLSEDLLGGVDGSTFPAPVGAVVATEALLVGIPAAILRQWCAVVARGRQECRTESERTYYGVTVAILAAGLLALWYVFPYRAVVSATGQENLPRFSSVDEATQFLRELRSWLAEPANWPWLAIPTALVAFPYAGLVARTPAFSRVRQAHVASRVQVGLAGLLFAISAILERLVSYAMEALRRLAVTLNRGLAAMLRWIVDVAINSADVLLRATAIAALIGIGAVFIVPGIVTGSALLVLLGVVWILGLTIAGIYGAVRQDK